MREIRFAWVCRNIHFNTISRVELTDTMLLNGSFPSWIKSNNCEVIAKILPTGLHDCKGKEVYEGDNIRNGDKIDEVIFHQGCFCYKMADRRYHIFDNTTGEVIGNKWGYGD